MPSMFCEKKKTQIHAEESRQITECYKLFEKHHIVFLY